MNNEKQKKTKRRLKQTIAILLVLFLGLGLLTGCEPPTPPTTNPDNATGSVTNRNLSNYYVAPLDANAKSNTNEGSVKYGATIVLGELDALGRPTFAHIRVKDEQEPGSNGEKRNDKINVDPVGWKNFKIDGNWANNRCHLVGYQFSGLNDELRNLTTGTSYMNKGDEGQGSASYNPECMLYYEQKLDEWLARNKKYTLDLYVRPVFEGSDLTCKGVYMQWTGFDENNNPIEINHLLGNSQKINEHTWGVYLENKSPSYDIDTTTGNITKKQELRNKK